MPCVKAPPVCFGIIVRRLPSAAACLNSAARLLRAPVAALSAQRRGEARAVPRQAPCRNLSGSPWETGVPELRAVHLREQGDESGTLVRIALGNRRGVRRRAPRKRRGAPSRGAGKEALSDSSASPCGASTARKWAAGRPARERADAKPARGSASRHVPSDRRFGRRSGTRSGQAGLAAADRRWFARSEGLSGGAGERESAPEGRTRSRRPGRLERNDRLGRLSCACGSSTRPPGGRGTKTRAPQLWGCL